MQSCLLIILTCPSRHYFGLCLPDIYFMSTAGNHDAGFAVHSIACFAFVHLSLSMLQCDFMVYFFL